MKIQSIYNRYQYVAIFLLSFLFFYPLTVNAESNSDTITVTSNDLRYSITLHPDYKAYSTEKYKFPAIFGLNTEIPEVTLLYIRGGLYKATTVYGITYHKPRYSTLQDHEKIISEFTDQLSAFDEAQLLDYKILNSSQIFFKFVQIISDPKNEIPYSPIYKSCILSLKTEKQPELLVCSTTIDKERQRDNDQIMATLKIK